MGAAGGPAPSRGEGHLGVNAQGALRERTTETRWSEPKFTLFTFGGLTLCYCVLLEILSLNGGMCLSVQPWYVWGDPG